MQRHADGKGMALRQATYVRGATAAATVFIPH
jgi:hypothetical protein